MKARGGIVGASLMAAALMIPTTPVLAAESRGEVVDSHEALAALGAAPEPPVTQREDRVNREVAREWADQVASADGQEEFLWAAERLREAAGQQFGEVILHGASLSLYVKGSPTVELQEAIASLNVPVTVEAVNFTEAEAKAEITRLLSQEELMRELGVSGAWPTASSGALRFEVDGDARFPAESPTGDASIETASPSADVEKVRQRIESLTDFDVEIEVAGSEERAPALWRWDDSNPFYGGNVVRTDEGLFCSTAFSAVFRDTGRRTLLTARHCGDGVAGVEWDAPQGAQRFVGRTTHIWNTPFNGPVTDAAGLTTTLAPALDGPYAGRMYFGAPNSNLSVNVSGFARPFVGLQVCGGGGFSGSVCLQEVTRINFQPVGYAWAGSPSFFEMEQVNGASIGQGDSGGPVYFPATTGAIGIGITSYIFGEAPCQGVVFEGRRCSDQSGAVQIADVLNSRNMGLIGTNTCTFQEARGQLTPC
jgi:hypothetical protein